MTSELRLLYITNNPSAGLVAERAGVDWIFVDLEYRGKRDRQANRDTVISAHTLSDIRGMRSVLTRSELLVRVNPWGPWSNSEIEDVLNAGADIVMLPYFFGPDEVKRFISAVNGRAKTCLLVETLAAVDGLAEIASLPGVDFVHIGLNDLHIERRSLFMFEFLADGGMDHVAQILRMSGVPFGFGGIARIGRLMPPAERILAEHLRLGSTGVILSRSFIQLAGEVDSNFELTFLNEVKKIRDVERLYRNFSSHFFVENRRKLRAEVAQVVASIRAGSS